ncbi:MAG: bifunctional folylpolyglutamate synthase/dihydrofolate synthase [Chloroflexi bacterium]|nr:bifunctional folylpolyglutamate synthase/dihydrofolate synthase [Chloroflexota bacterium]
MSYADTLHYLYSFSDYERAKGYTQNSEGFNLNSIRRLLLQLDDPHRKLRTVLVAGTKGKGSTSAMLSSILSAAGFRTGLYSQPHLHTFRERMRVNGKMISEEALERVVEEVAKAVEALESAAGVPTPFTTYEIATASAFLFFAREETDIVVLEVGLGGRLDATNVVEPLASVITPVSLDHTKVLGNTVEKIAREKAGIVKPGGVVLTAPQVPEALAVIERVCQERQAILFEVGQDVRIDSVRPGDPANGLLTQQVKLSFDPDFPAPSSGLPAQRFTIPLLGYHQATNLATAIGAFQVLRSQGLEISDEAVQKGLRRVQWPARLEILAKQPWVIADGAHNADSAARLLAALQENFRYGRLILILGTSLDKDIAGIVRELVPAAALTILTHSHHPRAAVLENLAVEVGRYGASFRLSESAEEALALARESALESDLICVTGSLFLAAEARVAFGLAECSDPI